MAVDIITLGLGVSTIAAIPIGAAVKKSYGNEKRLAVLETQNAATSKAIERLEAANIRIEGKLDRLIERFL